MNISFVIPAYNCEDFLEEAVDSIFDGNFSDQDELIIVNDCSTDNTKFIIENLIKKYSKFDIRYINNQKNVGCPASRNIGVNEARNELIFSFDADNILEKESIVKLKTSLLNNNADLVSFSQTKFFIKSKNKITHKWIYNNGFFKINDLFASNINPAFGNNFLFKKEAWITVNGFSEIGKGIHESWIFVLKLLKKDLKFYICPNSYYFHRYGGESLYTRERKNEKEVLNKIINKNLELFDKDELDYIKNNNPEWFYKLDKRPIKIKGIEIGKKGKLKKTFIGILKSIL